MNRRSPRKKKVQYSKTRMNQIITSNIESDDDNSVASLPTTEETMFIAQSQTPVVKKQKDINKEFYEYCSDINEPVLMFCPESSMMNKHEEEFALKFKGKALSDANLKDICSVFSPAPYIKTLLKSATTKAKKEYILQLVGIQIARSLSLIFNKPIKHVVPKNSLEYVSIRCVNKSEVCGYERKFKYDFVNNRLVLDEESRTKIRRCNCTSTFDHEMFLRYLCFETMVPFEQAVCHLKRKTSEGITAITKAMFGAYAGIDFVTYPIENWKKFVNKKMFNNKQSAEKMIRTLDAYFEDDFPSIQDYLKESCSKYETEYVLLQDNKNRLTGIMIFYNSALALLNESKTYTTHLSKVLNATSKRLAFTLFNGQLSDEKTLSLSLLVSVNDDASDLPVFVRASHWKFHNPNEPVPSEIIQNKEFTMDISSSNAHFTDHSVQMIKCCESIGIQKNMVSSKILHSLAKLIKGEPLTADDKECLVAFKFDEKSEVCVEDVITYNAQTCYRDYAQKKVDYFATPNAGDDILNSDDLPEPFRSLYEDVDLVCSLGKTDVGTVDSKKINSLVVLQMNTRDVETYITTLSDLFNICHKSEHGKTILDRLIRIVFSETMGPSSSWMIVNFIAQQNANPNGLLNTRDGNLLKLGEESLKLCSKVDFGVASNFKVHSFMRAIKSQKCDFKNENYMFIEKLQQLSFARNGKLVPKSSSFSKSGRKVDKNYYNQLIGPDLNITDDQTSTIVDLISKVNSAVEKADEIYSNVVSTLLENETAIANKQYKSNHLMNSLSPNASKDSSQFVAALFTKVSKIANDADFTEHLNSAICSVFKQELLDMFPRDCCHSTPIDCYHSFLSRVAITLSGSFSWIVTKPYLVNDFPVKNKHTATPRPKVEKPVPKKPKNRKPAIQLNSENSFVEDAADTKSSGEVDVSDHEAPPDIDDAPAADDYSEPPPKKLKTPANIFDSLDFDLGSFDNSEKSEVNIVKEKKAEEDFIDVVSDIVDNRVNTFELCKDIEDVYMGDFKDTKMDYEIYKKDVKAAINKTCKRLLDENPKDRLAISLNTLCSTARGMHSDKWLTDDVFTYFFDGMKFDQKFKKSGKVFLDGIIFKSMRETSNQSKTSFEYSKYKSASTIFCSCNKDSNHWITIILDKSEKSVTLIDSLGIEKKREVLGEAKMFLSKVWTYVGIKESDFEHYTVYFLRTPRQENGYDCGVFTIMNILQIANDYRPLLDQNDAKEFRYYICKKILDSKKISIGI